MLRLSLRESRILTDGEADCKGMTPRGDGIGRRDGPGSGDLDDRAGFEEAVALLLVDLELGEEAMADGPEGRFDGLGARVGEADGPSGPLVVAPGGAQAVDDDAEDLPGVSTQVADADRELEHVA